MSWRAVALASNPQILRLLDCYGGLLPSKQYDIISCYYEDDLSLSEIAENEGITRQGVSNNIKRAERFLQETEDKLGLLSSAQKLRDFAETMSDPDEKNRLLNIVDNIY